MRLRKKWFFAWGVFLFGCAIAWRTGASLPDYTAYATIFLGLAFGADITDKKLNGAH